MRFGASFQALRGLSTGKFVRAIAKDFGQVGFCYDAVVLFDRRFWTLGFSTVVGLARTNGPSAPIKFWRHRVFVARATRARLYHERDGD